MKFHLIAWRNLFRSKNKKRSFYTIASIFTSTFCTCLFLFFREGMVQVSLSNQLVYDSGISYVEHKDFERLKATAPLYLRMPQGEALASTLVNELKKKYIDIQVHPRNSFGVRYYREDNARVLFLQVLGVDLNTEFDYLMIDDLRGTKPTNDNEIVISSKVAQRYDLKVGDKMTLMTTTMRRTSNAKTFIISGIGRYPSQQYDQNVIMSYSASMSFAKLDGALRLIIYNGNPTLQNTSGQKDIQDIFAKIQTMEQDGTKPYEDFSIHTLDDTQYQTLIKVTGRIFFIITLIFTLLGSTVIANTSLMSIFEREKEMGTLKALGYFSKEIKKMFFFEFLYLGVIGAFLGVFTASMLSVALHNTPISLSFSKSVPLPIGDAIYIRFSWWRALFVFLFTIVVNLRIATLPVKRITKLSPVVAMRAR